jgi:hypothetical protein
MSINEEKMSKYLLSSEKKPILTLHQPARAMNSHPHVAPALPPVIEVSAASQPTACPIATAVKARAKALKKWRKQERLRLFSGWCASLHALGFSF